MPPIEPHEPHIKIIRKFHTLLRNPDGIKESVGREIREEYPDGFKPLEIEDHGQSLKKRLGEVLIRLGEIDPRNIGEGDVASIEKQIDELFKLKTIFDQHVPRGDEELEQGRLILNNAFKEMQKLVQFLAEQNPEIQKQLVEHFSRPPAERGEGELERVDGITTPEGMSPEELIRYLQVRVYNAEADAESAQQIGAQASRRAAYADMKVDELATKEQRAQEAAMRQAIMNWENRPWYKKGLIGAIFGPIIDSLQGLIGTIPVVGKRAASILGGQGQDQDY